jgi:hypothetical protein
MKKGGNDSVAQPDLLIDTDNGINTSGGDGILTAAAVPALLITANHLYKRRKSKKRGGMGPSTQEMLQQQMGTIQLLQNEVLPKTPSGTIMTNSAEKTIYSGGKGILESIAVPAVLLTANHLYRPRKRTQKRGKRSRRFSTKKR